MVSGPSGVGKGTLYNRLFQSHPDTFCLSVSHTTRAPRPGETDGEHYHFVTMEDFEALIAKDGFVEHAKFSGNRYGTSKATIEEQEKKGKVVVLDIEMEVMHLPPCGHQHSTKEKPREANTEQGVKQIQAKSSLPARYIFIAPPSIEGLEARLRGRGTEKEETIQKRMAQAKVEIEYSKTPGVHDKIIVNDNLEDAYKEFEAFVYKPIES